MYMYVSLPEEQPCSVSNPYWLKARAATCNGLSDCRRTGQPGAGSSPVTIEIP